MQTKAVANERNKMKKQQGIERNKENKCILKLNIHAHTQTRKQQRKHTDKKVGVQTMNEEIKHIRRC